MAVNTIFVNDITNSFYQLTQNAFAFCMARGTALRKDFRLVLFFFMRTMTTLASHV